MIHIIAYLILEVYLYSFLHILYKYAIYLGFYMHSKLLLEEENNSIND